MIIKAITLWQPWATLVAIGAKRIETRAWTNAYRGPLAIHAAKKWDRQLEAVCLAEPFSSVLTAAGYGRPADLPRGAVVAVVDWTWSGPTERIRARLQDKGDAQELDFGDYGPGRYGWYFENVRRLEHPEPASGAQGLWAWAVPAALVGPLGLNEPHSLYTYGYSSGKMPPAELMDKAQRLGAVVVDVRLRPYSQVPGWSKTELKRWQAYHHLPALGNANYKQPAAGIQLANPTDGLARLRELLRQQSVVLLCGCANAETCHRKVVADMLAAECRVEHWGQGAAVQQARLF